MHREMAQPSLVESLLPETLGRNERLERIDEVVDWQRLGCLVSGVYSAREGRPSYPPVMMVKALLLQQWYNLSDPQMEEALAERISFRRFDVQSELSVGLLPHLVGEVHRLFLAAGRSDI